MKNRIRDLREDRDLRQSDLAKATGYTKSTIEAFMAGARESDNVKAAIAAALEIEI